MLEDLVFEEKMYNQMQASQLKYVQKNRDILMANKGSQLVPSTNVLNANK